MMAGKSPDRPSVAPWRVLVALLCVLLVVIAGAAQAVHFHADGTDTHANCSLCAAAHVGVQVVQSPAWVSSVAISTLTERTEHQYFPAPLSVFALSKRPPPAA